MLWTRKKPKPIELTDADVFPGLALTGGWISPEGAAKLLGLRSGDVLVRNLDRIPFDAVNRLPGGKFAINVPRLMRWALDRPREKEQRLRREEHLQGRGIVRPAPSFRRGTI